MREFVRLTNCSDGNCPSVDQWTDTGDFRVQGYKVAAEDKPGIPANEDVVTVPEETVLQLLAQLRLRLA